MTRLPGRQEEPRQKVGVQDLELKEGNYGTVYIPIQSDHGGPLDLDPALIKRCGLDDARFFGCVGFVNRSVIQLNDLPIFDQRMWNPNPLTEAHGNAGCNCRFAIPRLSVEKQPRPRIDRRPNVVTERFVEGNVMKRLHQLIALR